MRAIITGASGFIGSHLVKYLKAKGYYVLGVDRKLPEFESYQSDDFVVKDLCYVGGRIPLIDIFTSSSFDECYCLAAEMGGAEYIFTGENDAEIMHNSSLVNLNTLEACRSAKIPKVFFASSACVYPEFLQLKPTSPALREIDAYPARPDSNYGWEKLYAERLFAAYAHNYDIAVRLCRLHNVFGPLCTWQGGREKAPAAICRKIAQASDGSTIDVIGDGKQTRSFLYIDEACEGIWRLTQSDYDQPLNLGSSELVSINMLVDMVSEIADKEIEVNHIPGPQGVRGRCSDNSLILEKLGWAPRRKLYDGLRPLYQWIKSQVDPPKAG